MTSDQNLLKEIIANVIDEQIKMEHFKNKSNSQKMLVLVTGGKSGADIALEQLMLLRDDGFDMQVLFTEAGERVLTKNWILSTMPKVPIIPFNNNESPVALVKNIDVIIIPIMTFNTAAKVANGIADNLVTSVILQAFLQGKRIIATDNACNCNNRKLMGRNRINQLYKKLWLQNIETLQRYGMEITDVERLRDVVIQEV